jgi:transposase
MEGRSGIRFRVDQHSVSQYAPFKPRSLLSILAAIVTWLNPTAITYGTPLQEKHIYLICDNYATHKHEKVTRWLDRHKRFHVYFTPTSASWLNMVERFFHDLTENQLRRGIFKNLEQLIMAIGNYIDQHNQNPKPFTWTAKASDTLEKVTRAQASLDKRLSV